MTVIQVMLNPFSKGFKVTPKGTRSDHYYFNWRLAWPLIMFIATAVSFWDNLGTSVMMGGMAPNAMPETQQIKGINLGWIWSVYNLLLMASLLILVDVPRPDCEWFNLRRLVRLDVGELSLWG